MEININLPEDVDRVALLGVADRNLRILRESLGVHIVARDGNIRLSGATDAVNQAAELISQLTDAARKNQTLDRAQVVDRIARLTGTRTAPGRPEPGSGDDMLDLYTPSRRVEARTAGQRRYLEAIRDHDMIFCTGPAGTGKTYLAVAAAVHMLKKDQVRKLVLVRPAVEAGEKLGFLPGDMQQKVNPYLRPLLDALGDMMKFDQVTRFMANDLIEVVPLAFMRGRTLNDAVIIMDEAQNTTRAQMLMFLTRLGHGGKMIVTGDPSQTDLPDKTQSGLIDAARRLRRIPGIAFVNLEKGDIVRHSLVSRVIDAYGKQQDEAVG